MIIKNWYFTEGFSKLYFVLPSKNVKIGGEVYGHPDIEDGKHIKTEPIKTFNKTEAITFDGQIWELGKVHSLYNEYVKNECIDDFECVA